MSQQLECGLSVSTGYYSGDRHYVEFDGREEAPMAEAVEGLKIVFDNPELATDPVFVRYRKYLKSFYPKTDADSGVRFLRPALEGSVVDNTGLDLEESGPTVEIMGHELSRTDLIVFTNYLMTNSAVRDNIDSRISFLDSLRSD